jgi:hypothetical protein
MPPHNPSSVGIEAMVARVAPAVLALLGDGVPRSRRAIVAALADRHPKDEVARTLMRLAVTGRQGSLASAERGLTFSLRAFEASATTDPGNAGWQRDLSVTWNRLGDVRVAQGDLAGALAAYTESKGIAERLAAADPGNAGRQRGLSVS